ncbi:MAG: paraslipin [Spirochaetes bacterium]|nr:paraslipin [Spirochaetota bacterium]
MTTLILVLLLVVIFVLVKMFVVVPMRSEWIKERLGKYCATLKPGFHFLIPFVDRVAYRVEMREQVLDIPQQSCITSDNIQVEVDGIVYLKVIDAYKASYGIGNYSTAAVNLAQTTMRSEIGKINLDNTFSEREKINTSIVREIDAASQSWGIKVMRYEIKNIEPSARVTETMEKQMEAEREKRAEITISTGEKEARVNVSEGERQAAINLSEGEKQKRINEAEGRAKEITLLAQATSRGISLVAESIAKPNGSLAVKAQLTEQFLKEVGNILTAAQLDVMPVDLAKVRAVIDGLSARSGQPTTAAK